MQALTRPPFGRLAGKISVHTGEGEFFETVASGKLLRAIAERSTKPVSLWLLGGTLGSGKTWTLSWLVREGPALLSNTTRERWALSGFYFLPRGPPDRAFFEAFFAASSDIRTSILEGLRSRPVVPVSRGPYANVVRSALSSSKIWGVLCGQSSNFPKKRGRPALPSWLNPVTRMGVFIEFLRTMKDVGFSRLAILVDEFEATVATLGTKGVATLSHFLRQLHDKMESTSGIPHTQVVLAGTREVINTLYPPPSEGPVVRVTPPSVLVQALRDRLAPTHYLGEFTKKDALALADLRIGVARATRTSQRYIPYEEQAIVLAYENSVGNVRNFVTSLESMYDEALSVDLELITAEFARKVLRKRGLLR